MAMIKVPHPGASCRKVSELAAKKARERIQTFGWSTRSIQALTPMQAETGVVGIVSKLKYLMHQERGIKPFLMWWVQDRTVPLGCKQGDGPHFRRGGHVGEPGYVNIPHVGRVYREQRWRHPGLAPKNFMRDAIAAAVAESRPEIKEDAVKMLKGQLHDNEPL